MSRSLKPQSSLVAGKYRTGVRDVRCEDWLYRQFLEHARGRCAWSTVLDVARQLGVAPTDAYYLYIGRSVLIHGLPGKYARAFTEYTGVKTHVRTK